ncbi:hypothetical protein sscle_02g013590 [Sclerotinia sclerotiorum 1980 UF-70]|uniref:C2H2-type domain-containing protein n=1 Tax=Sclerotinia sclerotiorum (strain ATCC 18683 / 1980 / Ss-1) TaxID=665079 RepID=A0A1D9PVF0_SCLS1|nr:hypothetical protein sscle_02g013590 [Sclerotinia sclerotiorum 1980 UF-70]
MNPECGCVALAPVLFSPPSLHEQLYGRGATITKIDPKVTSVYFECLISLKLSVPNRQSPVINYIAISSPPTPTFLQQTSASSTATGLSSPAPHQYTPFPVLNKSELDTDWSCITTSEAQSGNSLELRILPGQTFPGIELLEYKVPIHSDSLPLTMSTLGIQHYDPRFDAGARPSYTWPQFEMNEQFISQHDLSPHMSPHMSPGQLSPYDELKPSPIYARALSDSPPRAGLTPEQRELKRQRDHARRETKTRQRRERSLSNPYGSNRTTPDMLPRNLPDHYSNPNSLAPTPLLSQCPSSHGLPSPSYLTSYSPQVSVTDTTPSDMYGPVFTMGPNDFAPISAYSAPYSMGGPESTLPSYAPRPHSLSSASDQSSLTSIYAPHPHSHSPLTPLSSISQPSHSPLEPRDHVRVVQSRPKPQCWDHGCNGRQFSTFSNLLRHQREKSGVASKSSCPNCGAEFTRTTARNGHMAHEKCKQRRNS